METYFASFFFERKKDAKREFLEDLDAFDEQLKYMDRKRLLELGREFIHKKAYHAAGIIYTKLNDCEGMKEISQIYFDLIAQKELHFLIANKEDRLKQCIEKSINLHREGKIDKKDISAIELMVDEVSKSINPVNVDEFNKSYATFKEYIFSID
jgi:hypothetical protein